MQNIFKKKECDTIVYLDGSNLFDQIIVSGALTGKDYPRFQFYKAGMFNKKYRIIENGQYKCCHFGYGHSGYQSG